MKTKILKTISLIIILLFSVLMSACKKGEIEVQPESKVEKHVVLMPLAEPSFLNIAVGDSITLSVYFYESTEEATIGKEYTPLYRTSNPAVAIVENGVFKALSEGECIIIVDAVEDEEMHLEVSVTVKRAGSNNQIYGRDNLEAGELSRYYLKKSFDDVVWKSSNESVLAIDSDSGWGLGLKEGTATISAYIDDFEMTSREVTVSKYVAPSVNETALKFANDKLATLSLEQKVGQMFIGSSSGTSLSKSAKTAISDYHLGNFIYMGNNCTAPLETSKMSVDLQNRFKEANNGIPGFISIDQETGAVNRMNVGATRFLSNMALAATNNPDNAEMVGRSVGSELSYYGINTDLAPVLDVNNNPDNPIINNRSYGDSPVDVALFGTRMIYGLKSSHIMSCSKHFPGHGNTSTDSHLDLPMISSSLEDLYKVELAPFISSIYYGIDAIMTTHIVFSALDTEYPATLSKKVLTGLLRNELGYDGLIITDGMEMSAITKNYGKSQAAILAINAGADILCYTSVSDPMAVIPDVISAVNNGEIPMERIDDAVRRILVKKYQYNLFANYPRAASQLYNTTSNGEMNLELAKKAVTVYTNNFNGLDKSKNTIIMSSKSSFDLGYSGDQNSFGYYCSKYLKEKGMEKCDYEVISSITNSNKNDYINQALEYDQIVIAIDSANEAQISFVNELASKRSDIIVVALKLPYDYNHYNNVNTFITIYDKTPIMIEALTLLMNGEYEATGVCPVKLNK